MQKDVGQPAFDLDDVTPSLSSVQNGGPRKRPQAAPAANSSSDTGTRSTPSPTGSDPRSNEEIEKEIEDTIAKLPHWVDQLGGIRNLVIGGLVGAGVSVDFGEMHVPAWCAHDSSWSWLTTRI